MLKVHFMAWLPKGEVSGLRTHASPALAFRAEASSGGSTAAKAPSRDSSGRDQSIFSTRTSASAWRLERVQPQAGQVDAVTVPPFKAVSYTHLTLPTTYSV